MNNIHFITYATHTEGLFNELINNNFNINITVLGWNKKWNNYYDKIKGVYQFSKNINNDDIIVYLDGFDTIINKKIDNNFLKIFNSFNCDILLSLHPIFFHKYFVERVFGKGDDNGNIANAGLFMGYSNKINKLCEEILKLNLTDDQEALNSCMKKFNYKIDTNELIFKNSFNSNYKVKNEYFTSYPAASKGTIKNKINRYLRGIKEYVPYFKLEILIIIIIILLLKSY